MMRVSVDQSIPSPYIESSGALYRFKRRLTYSFAFRLLRKYFKPCQEFDILEIGTGSGFFLFFAKRFFQQSHLHGIEYDDRLLRETLVRAPYAKVMQCNAENFSFGQQHFDLVVSFQVIEHLYNPSAMLKNVHAHLKPGGIFLVTTPNLSGIGARIMKNRWHGYREDHVSLKGKDEWDRILISHGFSCLYSGSTFLSGIPLLNRFPLGILNWLLLYAFGSLPWALGESYVGLYQVND
jgi:SAM-dependent methyltransferase